MGEAQAVRFTNTTPLSKRRDKMCSDLSSSNLSARRGSGREPDKEIDERARIPDLPVALSMRVDGPHFLSVLLD